MKKRTFLLGAAVVALTAGSAAAADMPLKAPVAAPIVAPVFSWTGCYIGVHAGGGATRSSFTSDQSSSSDWGNGGLAGGQIGCNYQTGVFVFGIEGEGYWSGMKARKEFSEIFTGEGGFDRNFSEVRNKYDYTVAGRFGFTYERAFIYGKAGWAWGRFDFGAGDQFQPFTGAEVRTQATLGSATLNGPLFGVGVEYALTPNWTVKGEYNYINYGLSPVNFVATDCVDSGSCRVPQLFSASQSAEKHLFKFGVNYLFNFGATRY
jgi:outer membrane immunogenic protein